MPIRAPRLDDRSFPDLVAELLARIPGHTPEYTNPVQGDPGHTLIELFAWLTDTLLYRVNLIPERQRLEFLRMVGLPLRGARPAQGLVSIRYKDLESPTAAMEITRLRPWCAVSGPVAFETRTPVTVLPVIGQVTHKRVLSGPELDAVQSVLTDLQELYELGAEAPTPYVATPTFPADRSIPQGFDVIGETVDGMLWVALLAARADQVDAVRDALGGTGQDAPPQLQVGVVPFEAWDDDGEASLPAEPELGPGTSLFSTALSDVMEASTARRIGVSWEITTGGTAPDGGPEFVALDVLKDDTRGLTRAGIVELQLPSTSRIGRPENDVQVTIDAGVGPRPPRLDEDGQEERVVAWMRLRPTATMDRLALSWLGINAVAVDQRRTLERVGLGTSTGEPDQRFPLPESGVDVDTFALDVEEEGVGWVAWTRVDFLALGGSDDRVFELDPEEGLVRFGDGVRGRIPPAGRRVRARSMRAGGGPEGNLPPASLTGVTPFRFDGSAVTRALEVVQPTATLGGTPAETLEEAERRIPDVLRHRNRAVTRDDLVAVAAGTPGVRLGRVEVIKGFKPHQRREDVPGVVSVMVLPRIDGWMPPAPRPSRHTLEAVHAWVSERVPLTTELYAIGCEYVPIGLSVAYELREGFDQPETAQAIKVALRTLLWPLPPGGPFEDATGWPRARPVRERELEVAVARVPGVDEVRGIRLFVQREGDWVAVKRVVDGSTQIDLGVWQLPELLDVVVVTDDVAPDTLQPSTTGDGGVAVPVVPELC
ncbi:MAG: baseplate J/gp47 family protein [Myxococcales bacterium]|nr:baseplate J/gp47 family protein [Myxococcales bacterium]